MKIMEILRLHEMGYPQTQIKSSVKCARSTVGEVLKRCREVELTYEKAQQMTPNQITALLYPKAAHKYIKDEPDYESIHKKLHSYKNYNLTYLWTEYKTDHPNGLGYTQFLERYNRWLNKTGKNVTMHQEREPGRELFVDWMGDTLNIVVDSDTGELHTAHFFVACLGNSGFPYVEAFPDEKIENWLAAHVNALEYYGGLPRMIVPDNTKTAVNKPQYYDPVINPSYWEFARFYEVAIIPARVWEAQDKAPVESNIGWLETWLLGWLYNQRFFSFAELNTAIKKRVKKLCSEPFKKRPGSRQSVFDELDEPSLRALPAMRYERPVYKKATVPDNYHVEYMGFYYSVLYTYHRQKVTIRATSYTVEVLNSNQERIASHTRHYTGSRYVTNPDHMPKHHKAYWDSKQWDGARYRAWANDIGANTGYVIDAMLTATGIEEQAYKSCMGLLQLTKKYGNDRLENACAKARGMNSCIYSTVKNILQNGQDNTSKRSTSQAKTLPEHDNIRGESYYQ